jgi:serine/threonine-protein kinase
MAADFTCAHGHRWGHDETATIADKVCPVCGGAAQDSATFEENPATSTHDSDTLPPAAPPEFSVSHTKVLSLESDPALLAIGPAKIPGYEILAELGRGGMGVVYKARQTGLKRIVALKMILAGSHAGPEDIARFRIEAEAVARLRHPNIVQIYEIGEASGVPFFSLEFADSGSLKEALDGEPQAPEKAAAMVHILASAMQYAHENGIVHRDLKPANVLLVSGGVVSGEWSSKTGRISALGDMSARSALTTHYSPLTDKNTKVTPKITDFGLAKPLEDDSGLTKSGIILGTPSYMAPEQAEGNPAGPTADIYALGAILYEMLTGRPPFRANNRLDTILQVINDDPVPPRRLQPKVAVDLETICLKSLDKDARKRYASAGALAEDLGRFLANEPIQARPVGAVRRVVKWARRRPALAALVGVSLLALLILAGVIENSALRLKQERDFALEQRRIADQERDTATQAKDEAERQRIRAEANFERARRAVDRMLTRVGDEKLKNVPLLEELQRELLEDALEFNKQFLVDRGDDPAVRAEVARAYYRAAAIRAMLGKHDQAAEAFRSAINLQQRLAVEQPAETAFRKELAHSYEELALQLQEMRGFGEAEQCLKEAQGLLETLVTEFPTEEGCQRELAIVHNRKGLLLPGTARWNEVEPEYRKALDLLEPLATRHPQNALYRRDLSWTLENFGMFLAIKNRGDEAVRTLRDAIERLELLAHDFPKEVEYRQRLAKTISNLGAYFGEHGKPNDAEKAFHRTIEIEKGLVHDFPRVPSYRNSLALAYRNLSLVLESSGKTGAGIEPHRQALQLYEELATEVPSSPDYQRALAEARDTLGSLLSQTGHKGEAEGLHRGAISVMEKLAKEFPGERHYHSELGRELHNLAELLRDKNQLKEARTLIERAIEHQDIAYRMEPTRRNYPAFLRGHMDELAEILLRERAHASASKTAEKLSGRFPKTWEAQYDAACIFSRCVPLAESDEHLKDRKGPEVARSYADRALRLLWAAIPLGLSNADHMKKDPDLDPLRGRTDFQKLLAEVEQKQKAAKTAKK